VAAHSPARQYTNGGSVMISSLETESARYGRWLAPSSASCAGVRGRTQAYCADPPPCQVCSQSARSTAVGPSACPKAHGISRAHDHRSSRGRMRRQCLVVHRRAARPEQQRKGAELNPPRACCNRRLPGSGIQSRRHGAGSWGRARVHAWLRWPDRCNVNPCRRQGNVWGSYWQRRPRVMRQILKFTRTASHS